ncbi:hypothetical protein PTKIN_Ptkin03bG0246100 [Pterospermum kingtungense]
MVANSCLEVDEVKIRPRCFMDVVIRGYRHGRIVFELYEDLAPNTVKNFKTFCMKANYKKIKFELILKGIVGFEHVWIKHSLYHNGEKSNLKHDQVGLLSTPTDTSRPVFFITLSSCSQFSDNKNMVFGKIVKGLGLLKEMEKVMIDNCRPSIEVCNCGVISEDEEDGMDNLSGYPDWLLEDIIVKEKADFTSWLAVLETKSFLLEIKSNLSKAIEDCLEKQQEQRLKLKEARNAESNANSNTKAK